MLLRPDPDSAFIDPFYKDPTMVFVCNVKDPVRLTLYSRDPRYIAEKATRFLESSPLADTCYVGPPRLSSISSMMCVRTDRERSVSTVWTPVLAPGMLDESKTRTSATNPR